MFVKKMTKTLREMFILRSNRRGSVELKIKVTETATYRQMMSLIKKVLTDDSIKKETREKYYKELKEIFPCLKGGKLKDTLQPMTEKEKIIFKEVNG